MGESNRLELFNSKKEFFKLTEVAEALGVSRLTLIRSIEEGRLRAFRMRRHFMVKREDLAAFVENAEVKKQKG